MPSALRAVFGIEDHFAAGALIAVVTGVGGLTGLAIQRLDTRRSLLIGLIALVAGPVVTVSFVFAHSLPGLVVGSAIAGVGFGAGFQAPLRMLLATAAPTHRAGLLSSVYVVSYLAFGVPAVVAGLLEPTFGFVPVLAGYGAFIVLAATVALVLQLVSRSAADAEERAVTGPVRTCPTPPPTDAAAGPGQCPGRAWFGRWCARTRCSGARRRVRRRRRPCRGRPRDGATAVRAPSPSPRSGAAGRGAT